MSKGFAILIFVLLCGFGGWYLANPGAWNDQQFVSPAVPAPEPAAIPTSVPGQSPPTTQVAGASTGPARIEAYTAAGECPFRAGGEVAPETAATIFHWVDEAGQSHFSDKMPDSGAAQAYSPRMATRMDYFDLSVEYRGNDAVPFFRNELTAQATSIYEILAELVGSERLRQVQLDIVLFPDRRSYLQYAVSSGGEGMMNTDGFFSPRSNEAVTYIHSRQEDTLGVARHESTHVIVRGILGRAPMWLNEGLAEYFSMLNVRGQYAEVSLYPGWLPRAQASVKSGYPERLSDFLALEHEAWQDPARVSTHYALGWSLVYFLMSSEQGREALAAVMRSLADSYCAELDAKAVLAAAWTGGLPNLERDFAAWLLDSSTRRAHVH